MAFSVVAAARGGRVRHTHLTEYVPCCFRLKLRYPCTLLLACDLESPRDLKTPKMEH